MSFGFGFGFPKNYVAALFSPGSLFAAGEQGAWYDPSDLTTLFTDAAGTTPVTAVEQPVGLMLDKSKGLVLGPELVTNGDFSNGTTGWTLGAGWAISSGRATKTSGIAGVLTTSIVANSNKTYTVTFAVSNRTAGSFNLRFGSAFSNTVNINANGVYTYRIPPTSPGTTLQFSADANFDGSLDNISVRELPGNHAFQSTAASRPVLSARYNLLTKTEQFDDAVWVTFGSAVKTDTNVATAPNGTTTADSIRVTASNDQVYQSVNLAANTSYVLTCYVMRNADANQTFRLKGQTAAGVDSFSSNFTATSEWQQFSHTFTTTVAISPATLSIAGNSGGTKSDLLVWGADLRVANDGVNLPAYQRVNTSTDYDTAGFPLYLRCDGVDDGMVTNSIDFTGTDKMTVWAGVRKLSDAAAGMLLESSANVNSNNGAFYVAAPNGVSATFGFGVRGTLNVAVREATTYTAPISSVLSSAFDLSKSSFAEIFSIRINGLTPTLANTGNQNIGTGNYGNYPLYLFRRGGTTLPFNGRFYGLIVRGAQSTPAQITSAENWLNSKTRAF